MSKTMKSSSVQYGIIAATVITLLYVIFYVLNIELLASFWAGLLIYIGLLALGFISTAKAKSINEGYLTFKEAFSAYIIPILIGLLIPLLFLWVLFNFIDTESAEILKNISLEKAEALMARFGAPQSEIDKAIDAERNKNSYSISSILIQYGGSIAFASVIGLIAALTMKKSKDIG